MTVTQQVARRGRIFFGWWIVAAATVANTLTGGLYTYGFSTFFVPLIQEFGWTRAALSGAFSLARLEGAVLGPVEGFLVDRFGTRKFVGLGVTLFALGFILIGTVVNSLLPFYLVFIFGLALGAGLISVSGQVAGANWFIRKRSRAMGFIMSGYGAGGIAAPLLAWAITQHGWRTAAIASGVVVWLVVFPLAFLFRHKPEQHGDVPDGRVAEASLVGVSKAGGAAERSRPQEADFTVLQALRTPAFWLLSCAFALRMTATTAVAVHFIPFLIDLGFAAETAALMLGLLAWIGVSGRMGIGWVGDVVHKRYLVAACLGVMATSMLLLPYVRTLWQVVGFLLLYAPVYGGASPLMMALRGEYFGRASFGTIGGFMHAIILTGSVVGPVFAGWVYDTTQSYRLAFFAFAAVGYLAMLLVLFARKPEVPASGPSTTLTPRPN